MTDMVNSPSHYQLDGFEAIDIIKAELTPEERWAIFGSALESESTWIANINGSSSQSGVVAFDMEDGRPMGMGVC